MVIKVMGRSNCSWSWTKEDLKSRSGSGSRSRRTSPSCPNPNPHEMTQTGNSSKSKVAVDVDVDVMRKICDCGNCWTCTFMCSTGKTCENPYPDKKKKWKVNLDMLRDKFNCFVILALTFMSILNHPLHSVLCHPLNPLMTHTTSQNTECDWAGRGTLASISPPGSLVQTVTLRCTRGHMHWEQPKGGLKVTISPNIGSPYKLCLENTGARHRHRILLEEEEETDHLDQGKSEGAQDQFQRRRLLPILTTSHSNCYRIQTPSAVLYIESHGEPDTSVLQTATVAVPWNSMNEMDHEVMLDASDTNAISIAYEVESFRGDGDPCRPCTESEVLQAFCSSDVVARGSILHVQPRKTYDSIYVKADLVLHQNHPVFTPFQNLSKFLQTKSTRFDMDKPQRFTPAKSKAKTKSDTKNYFGGIVSHPSTCGASEGPGDFLWLIKFRFGIPLIDCAIYWDKWASIARTSQGECPLGIGNE